MRNKKSAHFNKMLCLETFLITAIILKNQIHNNLFSTKEVQLIFGWVFCAQLVYRQILKTVDTSPTTLLQV